MIKTAKLFMNGQSQAVRLPKEFRFEGKEVFIKKVGDAVVLMPYKHPWQSLVDSLGEFTEDFLTERRQPAEQQERESAFE